MSYFYSQQMTYCDCMMPRQIGYQVMNQLGQRSIVHFQQNNINYDNPYIKSYRRCDQALTQIKDIYTFIHSIKPQFKLKNSKSSQSMLQQFHSIIKQKNIPPYLYVNQVEDQINEIHKYLISQKKQLQSQKKQFSNLMEQSTLLITANDSQFLKQITMSSNSDKLKYHNELQMNNKDYCKRINQLQNKSFDFSKQTRFQFKCYIINTSSYLSVSKSLFRISRGNIYLQKLQIPEHHLKIIFKNHLNQLYDKTILVILFQQGASGFLLRKIQKLIKCYQSSKQLLTSPNNWIQQINNIQNKVKQLKNLIDLTQQSIERYLFRLYQSKQGSQVSRLKFLQTYIHKERNIYRQLSSCQLSQNFIHFNIFISTSDLPLIIHPHPNLPPLIMTPKQPPKQPPTKFILPSILKIPQQILNTYGVPSYREYNPAITYLITFGFFIGVMFGDVGHMLMAIPLLIYFKANKWFWTIIIWMGYCGIIYNEFFGLNIGIFNSCYSLNQQTTLRKQQCVYPMGIDSIWKISDNKMQFTNSLKMKLAVIIGVIHMLLGLGIRLLNNLRKKDLSQIFLVTIPQIMFMIATFLYMDFLIIYKWFQTYEGENTRNAPSIIATMIAIYAEFGGNEQNQMGSTPIFWSGQRSFERFMVFLCILMIPIMLFGKPIFIYLKRKKIKLSSMRNHEDQIRNDYQLNQQDNNHELEMKNRQYYGKNNSQQQLSQKEYLNKNNVNISEQQPMQQIVVHQFIETIEYVLGTVSNTASYLRLWALSLAHQQLSSVIFELILQKGIGGGYDKIFLVIILFPIFFMVTFFVLICMDSMQCFLHSLRLHWVQFQNKFYKGNGYIFEQFSFTSIHKRQ